MLRDRGPGRSPLDQVETDHVGGAFDEFLEDLRDLSEVAEQGQCRRTLAGANPLESFQGEREIFRMPGKNRLVHLDVCRARPDQSGGLLDRKSTRLNSSHLVISYAVFCFKKKKKQHRSVH